MDAAVFVLTADPPVSASERDLLRRVAGLSVTTFAVLNKADHLDEPGLAEAAEFTRRVLGEAGLPGHGVPDVGARPPWRRRRRLRRVRDRFHRLPVVPARG